MLEARAQQLGVDGEHDLSQPLRQPGRADRVPRRPPTSTSRRTSSRNRSPRARWPTRSAPARRSSRRRTSTRASCSPTAAACSCRGAIRDAIAREVDRSARRRRTAPRDVRARGRARRGHDVAGRRAPLRRELRARARAEHTRRRRTSFQAQTLATRPADLPEINLEAPPGHDRRHGHAAARHLQRAALRRRLLPRRQRARAAADDAPRGRGHRRPERGARARVALPRVRAATPSIGRRAASGTSCRTRGTGSSRCGSEDSHGRALWALGAVVGRAGDPGRHSLAGELFHAALPAVTHVHEPARVGVRAARHRRVPARLPGRQQRRSAARRRSPSGCSASSSGPSRPDWPWFEDSRDLLQRAAVAGAHRLRRSHGSEQT